MTGQEALDLLMMRLGNRTDSETRAALLLELNEAKNRLEQSPNRPSLLIYTDSALVTTAAQETLALPTDFLGEIEGEQPYYLYNNDRIYLSRGRREALLLAYGTEPGRPLTYALQEQMFFYPIPDNTYTLTWRYYKKQGTIADDAVQNTWLTQFGDLLMGSVGVLFATTVLRDLAAAQSFQRLLDAGAARYAQHAIDQEETNVDAAMGGEL